MTKFRPSADKLAISLSFLCVVHCLATPVLITFLPSVIALRLEDELFHFWMLAGVVPISLFALTLGCNEHRDIVVVGVGAVGIILLCGAAMLGHGLLGPFGERVLTLLGGGLIILGHIRNFAMCRQAKMCHCLD